MIKKRRNYMTSLGTLHLKRAAVQDMAPEVSTSLTSVAQALAASADLEKAGAVHTEVQMAAIRSTILKAVIWTIF